MSNKRTYHSPLRARQADETRRRMLASARKLFAAQGYGATTVEAIARDAGVSLPTFYAAFGAKRAVLAELLDNMPAEADVASLVEALREAPDHHAELEALVDFRMRLWERTSDIAEIIRGASAVDPDVGHLFQEGEARRLNNQAEIVEGWSQDGVLAPGLTAAEAGDILWALTGPDAYRLFVAERGWEPSRFREWLTSALDRLLFGPQR